MIAVFESHYRLSEDFLCRSMGVEYYADRRILRRISAYQYNIEVSKCLQRPPHISANLEISFCRVLDGVDKVSPHPSILEYARVGAFRAHVCVGSDIINNDKFKPILAELALRPDASAQRRFVLSCGPLEVRSQVSFEQYREELAKKFSVSPRRVFFYWRHNWDVHGGSNPWILPFLDVEFARATGAIFGFDEHMFAIRSARWRKGSAMSRMPTELAREVLKMLQ